jgi:hypothetical protein
LEGEPKWYLDWRRNPVPDPPDRVEVRCQQLT